MTRAGLTTNLLGLMIVPKPELGDVADPNSANNSIWCTLMNGSGPGDVTEAKIVAAWIEEGVVKLAVANPFGRTDEMFFKNVSLRPEVEDRV